MKIRVLLLIVVSTGFTALGQGTVLFDTHVPGVVDSRWVFPGAPDTYYSNFGVSLALFNQQAREYERLDPSTTLKTGPASEVGYVEPVIVTVPGISPGTKVDMYMLIFDLKNPSASLGVAGSLQVFGDGVTVGGGNLPPGYLTGFPAELGFIPEPPAYVLVVIALGGITLIRKRNRHNKSVQATAGERSGFSR